MGAISGYTAATAITDDDVLLGNDGSTTKKFPGTLFRMPATYIVASSDAPAAIKNRADYVCDGTADEVQINAALALGSVQLTDGRFYCAAPITMLRAGTTLAGTGIHMDRTSDGLQWGAGSALYAVSGFSGTAILRAASASSTLAISGQMIRDMTVDGRAIGSGIDGIHFRSYQGGISNVMAANCTGNGFFIEPLSGWDIYDAKFTRLHGLGNAAAGFRYTSADGHLSHSVFNDNVGDGIYASGSSWQITGVHCYANDLSGIYCNGGSASRTKISNSKIEHSGRSGIMFDGSGGTGADGAQVVGCGFNCNSEQNDNVYAHIYLNGTGAFWRGVIANNVFGNSDSAANTPQYALIVADQTRYLACIGNNFGADNGGAHATAYLGGATSIASSKYQGNIGITDQGAA